MVIRRGVDVDLSIVGKGRFMIQGTNGTFVLNGKETQEIIPGATFASPLHPVPLGP
jgi:hypothetical protein